MTALKTRNNSVFDTLNAEGCCPRCCLRYLAERDSHVYRNLNQCLNERGWICERDEEFPPTKLQKSNPCILCLGLLQDHSQEDAIQKIGEDVLECGYDCDSFTCAVSLPIAIQLREHSVWLYLVDTFPDEYSELKAEEHVVSIKEVWKWVVAPKISRVFKKEFDSGVGSDLFVNINVLYEDDEKECSCLLEMHAEIFQIRKQQKRKYSGGLYTRKAVETVLQSTKADKFKKHYASPPVVPNLGIVYDKVTCNHNSIFVAGRYNKYSRFLSQTPWVIDGERRMETSVQDLIFDKIVPFSRADGAKFSASGREDVDVRTLGKGRPFVVELLNPHKTKMSKEEIQNLQQTINESTEDIEVRHLQKVPREDLCNLKAGEALKTKTYTALCVSMTPVPHEKLSKLEQVKDLVLQQKTPIRVLHRRPLAVRERVIHNMCAEKVDVVHFKLRVNTQAGTYVKEFVHGDFGRTRPNLGELLEAEVDIVALDVEEIKLDWPPEVDCDQT